MTQQAPSIFNDAIGPVMRGASSSHVAAAHRIALIARDFMAGNFDEVLIEYDPTTSLGPTHESQGSDMGLFTGLMGWDVSDERMLVAEQHLKDAGITLTLKIHEYGAVHENTYRLTLKNRHQSVCLLAISTGGGMMEIQEINGTALSIVGDFHETLIYTDATEFPSDLPVDAIIQHDGLIQIKANRFITHSDLPACFADADIKHLAPVLPIQSSTKTILPFIDSESMLSYLEQKGQEKELWELALIYEAARGNISQDVVFEKMRTIVQLLKNSIAQGINGTSFADRMYPALAPDFHAHMQDNAFLGLGLYNEVILSVTALMDIKSSMGVIVAAPTAGSCGTLPGTCLGAAKAMGKSEDDEVKAMLAAGLIGVFIAHHATFSAELGGCQAETGSGSGMAAAALTTLMGAPLRVCLNAAAMALQNTFGLVCDPIANRVEAPCLGKNVSMAGNALSSANMAMAGFPNLVPLDETIIAMHKVGRSLPCELRCTGKGGLAMTPSGQRLFQQFNKA